MSTMQFKIVRGRVHNLKEVAKDVIDLHKEAQRAQDVEDLVREAIETTAAVKRLVATQGTGISLESTDDEVANAHKNGCLLNLMVFALGQVVKIASFHRRQNHTIDGYADLQLARHELNELMVEFSKNWMLPDEKRVNQSRQEISEGKFQVLS